MARHKAIVESVCQRVDGLSGGMLSILRNAVQSYGGARASQAAASLAFYAMFSLFPLLLALIAIAGFFLESDGVSDRVIMSVTRFAPASSELIESNIGQVLERRGTIGLAGLVGLLWSGTGAFTVLTDHINRAWTEAEPRGFLERRLMALGIGGVLAVLVLLPLLVTPIFGVLGGLGVRSWGETAVYERSIWKWLSSGLPAVGTFLAALGLYRWVPNTEVK